jgi:hypothetical protein
LNQTTKERNNKKKEALTQQVELKSEKFHEEIKMKRKEEEGEKKTLRKTFNMKDLF